MAGVQKAVQIGSHSLYSAHAPRLDQAALAAFIFVALRLAALLLFFLALPDDCFVARVFEARVLCIITTASLRLPLPFYWCGFSSIAGSFVFVRRSVALLGCLIWCKV